MQALQYLSKGSQVPACLNMRTTKRDVDLFFKKIFEEYALVTCCYVTTNSRTLEFNHFNLGSPLWLLYRKWTERDHAWLREPT